MFKPIAHSYHRRSYLQTFLHSLLKILAMIFMVIDHFGQVVLKNGIILHAPYSMFTDDQFDMLMSTVNICHILGRIAFPVFCLLQIFLLVIWGQKE